MSYKDIMDRLALIIDLAEPLTCSPDDNSVLATMIQKLARYEKTPAEVREELGDDWQN